MTYKFYLMSHLHRRLFIQILWLFSLPLGAQEPPTAAARELRLLALTAVPFPLSLGMGANAPNVALSTDQFFIVKKGQLPLGKKIDIFIEVPAPPVDAVKGASIPLAGVAANAAPRPVVTPHKVLYATAVWPENSSHAIGFLIPEGGSNLHKGKLVLLADSPELHPEHAMRAINLTPVPLGIRLGDKNAVVPAGGELISSFDPGRLRIDIALSENGSWKLIVGSYLATARH